MAANSSRFVSTARNSTKAREARAGAGVRPLAVVLTLASLLGLSPLLGGAAWALDTGTLKLMVTNCSGTAHDDVLVEVEIYRPGSGVIATDDGYTVEGYVEFAFTVLQSGDLARVKVDACGSSEMAHVYVWVSDDGDRPGMWDIESTPDSVCEDTWWDQEENIIQLRCE